MVALIVMARNVPKAVSSVSRDALDANVGEIIEEDTPEVQDVVPPEPEVVSSEAEGVPVDGNIGNENYREGINYIYNFEYKKWFWVKKNAKFFWRPKLNSWTVSNKNIEETLVADKGGWLDKFDKKVVEMAHTLEDKGTLEDWREDFTKMIYYLDYGDNVHIKPIYFKSQGNWRVSLDNKDWEWVANIDDNFIRKIGNNRLVKEFTTKDFESGIDFLAKEGAYGLLETLEQLS